MGKTLYCKDLVTVKPVLWNKAFSHCHCLIDLALLLFIKSCLEFLIVLWFSHNNHFQNADCKTKFLLFSSLNILTLFPNTHCQVFSRNLRKPLSLFLFVFSVTLFVSQLILISGYLAGYWSQEEQDSVLCWYWQVLKISKKLGCRTCLLEWITFFYVWWCYTCCIVPKFFVYAKSVSKGIILLASWEFR